MYLTTKTLRPEITPANQQTILELLCSLLSPLGEHRRNHVRQSKGKRHRRRRQKADREAGKNIVTPSPPPELFHHITIGFNTTIKLLQHLNRLVSSRNSVSREVATLSSTQKIAAIFVCTSTLPALLTSHIPILIAAASVHTSPAQRIRLISLPKEAEKRLSDTLFQPRVGFVGLLQDAPGGGCLMDHVMDKVPPVEVSWLQSNAHVDYMPVKIQDTSMVPDQDAQMG